MKHYLEGLKKESFWDLGTNAKIKSYKSVLIKIRYENKL